MPEREDYQKLKGFMAANAKLIGPGGIFNIDGDLILLSFFVEYSSKEFLKEEVPTINSGGFIKHIENKVSKEEIQMISDRVKNEKKIIEDPPKIESNSFFKLARIFRDLDIKGQAGKLRRSLSTAIQTARNMEPTEVTAPREERPAGFAPKPLEGGGTVPVGGASAPKAAGVTKIEAAEKRKAEVVETGGLPAVEPVEAVTPEAKKKEPAPPAPAVPPKPAEQPTKPGEVPEAPVEEPGEPSELEEPTVPGEAKIAGLPEEITGKPKFKPEEIRGAFEGPEEGPEEAEAPITEAGAAPGLAEIPSEAPGVAAAKAKGRPATGAKQRKKVARKGYKKPKRVKVVSKGGGVRQKAPKAQRLTEQEQIYAQRDEQLRQLQIARAKENAPLARASRQQTIAAPGGKISRKIVAGTTAAGGGIWGLTAIGSAKAASFDQVSYFIQNIFDLLF